MEPNGTPPSAPSVIGRIALTIVVLVVGGVAAIVSLAFGQFSKLNCLETCPEGMYKDGGTAPFISQLIAAAIVVVMIWLISKIW
jgi:hypothetical protein